MSFICGKNAVISENAKIGNNVRIGNNCIVEDDVFIEDDVYIDSNTVIRSYTKIKRFSSVGANCVIGEYQMDFYSDRKKHRHVLCIGEKSIIRSGSIIYSGSEIGDCFQTGHNVTVRENSIIGNNVSVGTLSDIQGDCKIGDYVRLHSNVHVGKKTVIDDYCWIFPYVVLTNDPIPPSDIMNGVHIHSFAIIASAAVVLPGINIKKDSLVGAGTIVVKDVEEYEVVVGNPGRVIGDIRDIRNDESGEAHYPWRYCFDRNMPWEGVGYEKWINDFELR